VTSFEADWNKGMKADWNWWIDGCWMLDLPLDAGDFEG